MEGLQPLVKNGMLISVGKSLAVTICYLIRCFFKFLPDVFYVLPWIGTTSGSIVQVIERMIINYAKVSI